MYFDDDFVHFYADEPPAKRRKTDLGVYDKKIPEETFYPEIAHDIDVGVTTGWHPHIDAPRLILIHLRDDLFAMDTAPDQTDYRRSSEVLYFHLGIMHDLERI